MRPSEFRVTRLCIVMLYIIFYKGKPVKSVYIKQVWESKIVKYNIISYLFVRVYVLLLRFAHRYRKMCVYETNTKLYTYL